MDKQQQTPGEKQIQGYLNWKQNSAFLYDYVGSTRLKTMSITFDWSHQTFRDPNDPSLDRQLALIGTFYKPEMKNKNRVKLVSVALPPKKTDKDTLDPSIQKIIPRPDESLEYEGFGFENHTSFRDYAIRNEAIYLHPSGEANRIRFNPFDESLCATSSPNGSISLIKLYHQIDEIIERRTGYKEAIATFGSHQDENWSIKWNPYFEGRLLSCGLDSRIDVWDIKHCQATFRAACEEFNEPPMDAVWRSSDTFISVDEGGNMKVFDLRDHYQMVQNTKLSSEGLNAIDKHPGLEYIVVTAGEDGGIRVVDLRKQAPVTHLISHHNGSIQELSFHPHRHNYILTGDSTGVANIFDLSKIGKEQSDVDEADGPGELIFSHTGHLDGIKDVRWNPLGVDRGYPFMAASVAEDGVAQIWCPNETLMKEEDPFLDTLDLVLKYEQNIPYWKMISMVSNGQPY